MTAVSSVRIGMDTSITRLARGPIRCLALALVAASLGAAEAKTAEKKPADAKPAAASATTVEAKPAFPKPLFKDFMGINGHFTFKPELYRQVCRMARNYHNLNWDVAHVGDGNTIPVCVNQVDWKSNVYGPWAAAGFETDICIQFAGFGPGSNGFPQLWAGKEQWCFDYGKTMASYFGPSGGQKLATSFEIDNEPGQAFDADLYKTIFVQMAKGIRAGDPKARILMATAQANDDDGYSLDLRKHFAEDEVLPLYDAINIHTYATMPRRSEKDNVWTRSYPEDPGARYLQPIDQTIAWRNDHAKGKEIWVTEFGYDACTPEAMNRRESWFKTLDWQGVTDLQQAQYLVRSFFAFAERDVQRAYIYFYDDNDSPSVHGCAGLTRGFAPKPSFWAVRQLYQTLGDYRFKRVVRKDAGNVCVDEFVHGADPTRVAWLAWSPTGVATNAKDGYAPHASAVTLADLPALPEQVVGMATADGDAPKPAWEKSGPRAITLTVGESPIYLLMTVPGNAPKADPKATPRPAPKPTPR